MEIKILAGQFYDYSFHIRGYSKETIKRYKNAINFFCKATCLTHIEQINEKNVHQFFMYGRVTREWSPGTFITYHKTLVVFFRWCVEKNHIEKNYAEEIETPKLNKGLPKKIEKEDAFKLLEVSFNYPYTYKFLRHRDHAIFSMFLFAGLRKTELLNLKLTEVDIDNLTIFVTKGKGGKDRIIPMSHTLAQSLSRYLEERKRLRKTCPEFFTSPNRNQGFTDSGMKRLVRKMKDASKIDFSIHKLRHTFATLMVEGGCDIYSLSRMMGHSDIKTTTIYLSATAEHLRGQMVKHPLNL